MSSDDEAELREIDTQERAEEEWEDLAADALKLAAKGRREAGADTVARDKALDTFLAANRRLQRMLDRNRVEELRAAALVPVKSILLLSSVFGLVGIGFAYRSRRTAARGAPQPKRRPPATPSTRTRRRASPRACRWPRTSRRATSCCART